MAITEACQVEQEDEHKTHREKIRTLLNQTFTDLAPKLTEITGEPQTPKKAALLAGMFMAVEYGRENALKCGPGWVYFILADDLGLVKIGHADNVRTRLDSLRGMSPVGLTLIATIQGDQILERSLHKKFARLRDHGEWFRYTMEISQFIKETKANGSH